MPNEERIAALEKESAAQKKEIAALKGRNHKLRATQRPTAKAHATGKIRCGQQKMLASLTFGIHRN